MFYESLKKQFSWNLMLRHTVKLALNYISWNTLQEKFHIVFFPLRDVIYFAAPKVMLNYMALAIALVKPFVR